MSIIDISAFKGALKNGGARPNQFRVQLSFPQSRTGDADTDLLVTGAALPASTVNPAIIQYRGREIKFAGERIFDPWTITIVNDNNFSLRRDFENWMELMNEKASNAGDIAWQSYTEDLNVIHLDRRGKALEGGSYTLHDAFPINMSEIALQYAQNDILEEFTVTFQYQHYTTDRSGGQSASSSDSSISNSI